MNSLRGHISLIFALVCLLFSVQLYLSVGMMTQNMEERLKNDYSIVAVSSIKQIEAELKKSVKAVKGIEQIDATPHLGYLRQDLSAENYALLQESLPFFYKIRLSFYPSADELKSIENKLKSVKGITKVESFAKTQNTSYALLAALKNLLIIFIGAIFIINMLLFMKFMQIWRYEHASRMRIMAIFGAPLWMRSVVLFKMAIVDAAVSGGMTLGAFWALSTRAEVGVYLASLGLGQGIPFDLAQSAVVLFSVSFGVSLFSVSLVAFRGVRE